MVGNSPEETKLQKGASELEDVSEKPDVPEKADMPERADGPEKADGPERADRPEKADAPELMKKTPGEKKPRKRKTTRRLIIEFFLKIGITVLAVVILLTWVVGIYVIHDNSSYPMLKDGDLCVIYRLATLNNGDEVAYVQDDKLRFGRIVALPGDVVDISEDALTVNGYGVYEDAVYPTTGEGAKIRFPYTVPEGTYFILNDYRSDVNDSRTFGAIPKGGIKGKVVFVMRRRGI